MGNQREIPSAAKTWGLRKHTVTKRRPKEKEKGPYHANVTIACKGPADESGEVAERWAVADFSIRNVLTHWGPGRYSVDWYDKANNKIDTWKFEAREPQTRTGGGHVEIDGDDTPTTRLRGLATSLDGGGVVELMLLLRAEGDAAAARARAEAERAADRDRQFMQAMLDRAAGGAGAAAAPATDLARELALMRRELSLQLREQNLQLRSDLQVQAAANADTTDRPETAKEALNSAGVEMIETLGEGLADIGPDLLGAVRKWLRSKGLADTPQNLAALVEQAAEEVAALNGQANGAAAEAEAE
jgi:hypothetical protein